MKISFTGAQSTGKTTLLNLCKENFPEFTYVDEVTRRLKREKGVEINNTADNYDETQIEIINDHIENLKINDKDTKVILDRCIYDGYIYTKYLHDNGKVSNKVLDIAYRSFRRYRSEYDIIFYTDPRDVKLVDDGERSTDMAFRDSIINIYEFFNLDFESNVVRISGTVEQRWNMIKEFLEL